MLCYAEPMTHTKASVGRIANHSNRYSLKHLFANGLTVRHLTDIPLLKLILYNSSFFNFPLIASTKYQRKFGLGFYFFYSQ